MNLKLKGNKFKDGQRGGGGHEASVEYPEGEEYF